MSSPGSGWATNPADSAVDCDLVAVEQDVRPGGIVFFDQDEEMPTPYQRLIEAYFRNLSKASGGERAREP